MMVKQCTGLFTLELQCYEHVYGAVEQLPLMCKGKCSQYTHCAALSLLCAALAEMCSCMRRKIVLCRIAANGKLVQNCKKFDLRNRTGQVQNCGASRGTVQCVAPESYKASQITRKVTAKMQCQNWLLHIKLLLVVKTKAAAAMISPLLTCNSMQGSLPAAGSSPTNTKKGF